MDVTEEYATESNRRKKSQNEDNHHTFDSPSLSTPSGSIDGEWSNLR